MYIFEASFFGCCSLLSPEYGKLLVLKSRRWYPLLAADVFFDAEDVCDDVNVGAIGGTIIITATKNGSALAGTAHVTTLHNVAEALESTVVFAPAVGGKPIKTSRPAVAS